ncbi:hypothetical protein ACO0LF_27230 [Undibacterium sp. Di27W]|uniref:hypothetical protein n=1 Tax=Undibacterium sp. Di27W TaxID=3413036 RepID=UPI003BF0C736
MLKKFSFFLACFFCLSLCAHDGFAENKKNYSSPNSRTSKERPTALPENKALAEQFAKCAAGLVTHIIMAEALKLGDTKENEELGNWLWFNAIDLSEKQYVMPFFEKRLKELNAMSKKADEALAKGDKALTYHFGQELLEELNKALAEGADLYKKYKDEMNTVTTNADGSFTISLRCPDNKTPACLK